MKSVYTVLLKKNLRPIHDNLEDSWMSNKYTHWIALGHFDDIYVYQLENDTNFFQNIKRDKNRVLAHSDEDAYYHSLYLVPDGKPSLINDYSNRFIAIVRIHFPKSFGLTNQFSDIKKSVFGILKSNNLPHQVYYATEFSDMVLDIRSNKFSTILNTVLKLRQIKDVCIGKLYTYFGINSDFIFNSSELPEEDDIIPFFSMRFSGYNIQITKEQINLVKKHFETDDSTEATEYCINGIDDIMLIYKNCSTTSLVNLYRDLFLNKIYENLRKSESSTRVGVEINLCQETFQESIPDKKLIESPMCKQLSELCKSISKTLISKNLGWSHAILEIANSLVRMSKTPIMDEVVYLVAPGVRAFLQNVKKIINDGQLEELNSNYIYEYVESCSYFIEQLMRIEGQLSHNPEIRPIIYDIPVFMLEYTIAFLNKVSKLLQSNDKDRNNYYTAFLLVPHPCEIASASEIFPPAPNESGLVHIQIPENTLYKPADLFRALCHEVSHYVGEKLRNREYRKVAYAHACASLLVDRVFQTNDQMLIKYFKKLFKNSLDEISELTISKMHDTVIRSARKKILSKNGMNDWLIDCFSQDDFECAKCSKIDFIEKNEIEFLFEHCFKIGVDNIDVLFREVIADICMLYILNLDTENYIESLLQELHVHNNSQKMVNEGFAIRIYITLTSMGKEIIYNKERFVDEWKIIYSFISKIKDEIESKRIGYHKELTINSNATFALKQYAKKCYDTISNELSLVDIEDVRKMYTDISQGEFNFQDILKTIEQYRENMIL